MQEDSLSFFSESGTNFDLPESLEKKLELNVPAYFSQTFFARSNSSIFAQKLNELSASNPQPSTTLKYRIKWLQILRDYSKLNSLYPILYYAYEKTVPPKYFDLVKTKYLRIWSSKCKKSSNRQMWLKIGQLLKINSYKAHNSDDKERLSERRISIASKYLTNLKQYQPNFDFFILNAIPTITSNMRKRDELEEQEEREHDDLIRREFLFNEPEVEVEAEPSPIKKKRKKVSNKRSTKSPIKKSVQQTDQIEEQQTDQINEQQTDQINEHQNYQIDEHQNDQIDEHQNYQIDEHQNDQIDEHQNDQIDEHQNDQIDEHQNDQIDEHEESIPITKNVHLQENEIKQTNSKPQQESKSKHQMKYFLFIFLTAIAAFSIGFLLPFCFYKFDVGGKLSNLINTIRNTNGIPQDAQDIDELFPDEDIQIDHYYYYYEEDFEIEEEAVNDSFMSRFIEKLKDYSIFSRLFEFLEKKNNQTIPIENQIESNETGKYEYIDQIIHELKYKILVACQNQEDSNQTKQLKKEIKILRDTFIKIIDEEERNISIIVNHAEKQIENKENHSAKIKEIVRQIVSKAAERIRILEEDFHSKLNEIQPIHSNEEEIQPSLSKIDHDQRSNQNEDDKQIENNELNEQVKTKKRFKKSKLTPEQRKEKHIKDVIEKITNNLNLQSKTTEDQLN